MCPGMQIQIDLLINTAMRSRPEWDFQVLTEIGFERVSLDNSLSDRIYLECDETFNPVRMFRIDAVKA